MKIAVEFDSLEEFEAFRTSGKKTRGGKADKEEAEASNVGNAPPPLPPPTGGAAPGFNPGATSGFAPQGAGAAPGAGGFPAAGAPQVAPEVQAIVNRIIVKLDAAIASGQPAEAALTWMQGQCAAPGATMDQIKQVALPKLSMPQLDNIAKLMAA